MFNPNPALSVPGWTPTPTAQQNLARSTDTAPFISGSVASASGSPAPGSAADLQRWDSYIAQIQAALQASAGAQSEWQREQLKAQLKDAEKARQNAYKIAQLSAETSRYGVDVGRQNMLDQLKENARQFDANHALEQQKFGLSVADSYTRYSQTPDLMFARNDLMEGLSRAGVGLASTPLSGRAEQPRPKTWEDFAALSGFTANAGVPGEQPTERIQPVRSGDPTGRSTDAGMAEGVMPGTPASGNEAGPDPRERAVRAVMQAIPPSETPGTDGQDWAALAAIRNLYFAGRPGTVERLGASRRKTAQAGLARLGYDPARVEEEYRAGLPGQQSSRLA
jgi:hypothetical protein